ncbi:pleckstrin homology domain-containing family A member 5 isoform X9 [Scleropages formosus]|uniref:pleckstrin homology domain-containing family A member 5 isoform X9 n=1 Tax=Scleropages formosus TaxID=113540 RepID=UPI0010FA697A|nr:pleckstrin homology domain-containing family A member 5-like isoform X9 [Scleropages formosus]
MAADLSPEWLSCLPSSWSYGVTRDGRIFFINEEAKSTTWLHPVTGEAVLTGHRKTADLPTGWEEGFTFEGARCFINHNERKVTCKHPVSGLPSQDNCIFVVNEHLNCGKLIHPMLNRPVQKVPAHERKERPLSTMSEVSNYTGGSDHTTHTSSPAGRPSRSSKKVHNFGKRSNSIKRNPNAPVVKSGWLYKQDSTGMKLWKKRWFVLCDMCLFYYRDEKEEGILGSILLPSFHISMLSVEDHINRKYAFKATHPNMRTYYFCTDTPKEMESWMKVMTDAALVHSEPVKRLEKVRLEQQSTQEPNNMLNHRVLTLPELQNNERNREASHQKELRLKDSEQYGFPKDGVERSLTKVNSIKLQPAQSAVIQEAVAISQTADSSVAVATPTDVPSAPPPTSQYKAPPPQVNGSGERTVEHDLGETSDAVLQGNSGNAAPPALEAERTLKRTNSMQQLEHWMRTQRGRSQEDDSRSILSYQTLPRNMPSHRAQVVPQYPEGYRTLPRNSMARPDSICSVSPSLYEHALEPPTADKRRSMRDDTMWQLYEWQQRQTYGRQGAHPTGPYGTLPSPRTMVNLSEHVAHSIPPSPSHGSLALYQSYSPLRSYNAGSRSEVSSPVFRGDVTVERRRRPHPSKYAYPPDRRSMPAGIPMQTVTPQSLQGKTMSPEDYRENSYTYRTEDFDIDAKLSRLCEQDKVVQAQDEKLQQLHREKHTLETALLSASQEIELSADNPAAVRGVVQQRDVLQSGLLSTCRELTRVTAELERSWRTYDKLESEVALAKQNLLEQLEALGSPKTEPPTQKHVQIQKELWRIQDVTEALSKNKPQRSTESTGFLNSRPISNIYKSEGPDYRLYKSEPELTTVAEVDENNGEDRSEQTAEKDPSIKGMSYPVGIVPPRTKSPMPESSTIASYVTLRKSKKPDTKTDRPRSAVEQLCVPDSARPRMSLEEQLERIKRHQNASLKDKRKSLNILSQENSPSRNSSFSKENTFRSLQQSRKREETVSGDIQMLEASLREQELLKEQETPAEEIARLKEAVQMKHLDMDQELAKPTKVHIPERYVEAEPEEVLSPEEEADKQKKVNRIKTLIAKNSVQNMVSTVSLKTEHGADEEAVAQEKIINISYELAAEASRRSKLVAVKSLSSPPQSPTSSCPEPHPQLADGSHFITGSDLG